jgi:hypothetical protein
MHGDGAGPPSCRTISAAIITADVDTSNMAPSLRGRTFSLEIFRAQGGLIEQLLAQTAKFAAGKIARVECHYKSAEPDVPKIYGEGCVGKFHQVAARKR